MLKWNGDFDDRATDYDLDTSSEGWIFDDEVESSTKIQFSMKNLKQTGSRKAKSFIKRESPLFFIAT